MRIYSVYLEKNEEHVGTTTDRRSQGFVDLEDAVDFLYELSEGEAKGSGLEAEWAVPEADLPEGILYLYYYVDYDDEG